MASFLWNKFIWYCSYHNIKNCNYSYKSTNKSFTEIFILIAVGLDKLRLYPYLRFLSVINLSHGNSKLYLILFLVQAASWMEKFMFAFEQFEVGNPIFDRKPEKLPVFMVVAVSDYVVAGA